MVTNHQQTINKPSKRQPSDTYSKHSGSKDHDEHLVQFVIPNVKTWPPAAAVLSRLRAKIIKHHEYIYIYIWDKMTHLWYRSVIFCGFGIVSVLLFCLSRLARRAGTGLPGGVRGCATFAMLCADCFTEMQCRWCSENMWRSVADNRSTWMIMIRM